MYLGCVTGGHGHKKRHWKDYIMGIMFLSFRDFLSCCVSSKALENILGSFPPLIFPMATERILHFLTSAVPPHIHMQIGETTALAVVLQKRF